MKRYRVMAAAAILIIFFLLAGNHFIIHTGEAEAAAVEDKGKEGTEYYILLNGRKLMVEDENVWNMIEVGGIYDIAYEWYGNKDPVITSITFPGYEGSH
ncbi:MULTISPECIES: hypothetical protein [Bacillaceae]|uniref:hypothetical protein n=1 Tax=Bacillaceae TaxID=186817 RepID=UPI0029651B86|nr:hypothetical protein [Bacillus infantis]MDW2878661.1 hypothetical protein [Bacillus infantis]